MCSDWFDIQSFYHWNSNHNKIHKHQKSDVSEGEEVSLPSRHNYDLHKKQIIRNFEMVIKISCCTDMLIYIWQVDELMGNMENAAASYSKAVQLLGFLLVEAPSLILNPPFSLTSSDRYRLRNYIEILSNRQGYSRSQRMAILKCEDQQWTPW